MTTANPAIWPSLGYGGAEAATRFLETAFGFEPYLVVPGHGGRAVAHAELRGPAGERVHRGSPKTPSWDLGRLSSWPRSRRR